jgi:hypothetical protein
MTSSVNSRRFRRDPRPLPRHAKRVGGNALHLKAVKASRKREPYAADGIAILAGAEHPG